MLKYRFHVLKNIVDYFIIVESSHTFMGKEKSLVFQEHRAEFSEFEDKIVYICVNDSPHKYPNICIDKAEQWTNEYHQRDAIARGFGKIPLKDQDILILADVDEIPDRDVLAKIKRSELSIRFHTLELDFYYYNLNSRIAKKWGLCRIFTFNRYKELKMTCSTLRKYPGFCPTIQRGGWHLSYFGDSSFIKNKIEEFSHQEYNKDQFTDKTKIEERIHNTIDIFDRTTNPIQKISIKDNTYLPHEYDTYLTQFIAS